MNFRIISVKQKIFIALFVFVVLAYSAAAFADCYDECMSIKGCWHKGEGYSSYCGSAEVNCGRECELKKSNQKSYGAIAYSTNDGSYGYSNGQDSRGEAEQIALNYCNRYSKNCKAMVWFQNSCGAVAADGKKTGWGQADTESEAQQKALKSCGKKKCEVKVSHCSF